MSPSTCRTAILSLLVLTACQEGSDSLVAFVPDVWRAQPARPGLTTAGTLALRNGTDLSWQLTALGVTAEDADQEAAFTASLADTDLTLPFELPPQSSVDVLVTFSPDFVQDYGATVTAALFLHDFQLGGGGCSSGCGASAPADEEIFAVATISGLGDESADFEECDNGTDDDGDDLIDCDDPDCVFECGERPEDDCGDGIDNDGDGDVDCDDPDCAGTPECGLDGCEPVGGLGCDVPIDSTTRGRSDQWQDYCDVGADAWTGPEEVWTFVPEESGVVQVMAFGQGWDLDLTVLEPDLNPDGTLSCDPDRCLATSWRPPGQPEQLEMEVEQGRTYLIVVDGADGDAGEYQLFVTCPGGAEFDCGNFVDDDGDGLVDCEDDDCRFDPVCTGGGDCVAADALVCGMVTPGSNDQAGSTNSVDAWCGDQGGWTGPEYAWMFFPSGSGPVTVRLTGLTEDLDLQVLSVGFGPGPAGGDCNPDACLAQSWNGGGQDEEVTWDADVNQVYVIAIDGWDGAISSFNLVVECEQAGFEDCFNLVDDDGDGLADCDDPDCFGTPFCGGFGEICDDGVDDDGDGLVDCDDVVDCNTFPGCDYGSGDCCAELPNPGCSNDAGEDCVCSLDPYCCQVTWDALCVQQYESQCGGSCQGQPETDCADGADNDNDGLIDCVDVDCFGGPNCVGPTFEFACFNNVDDDFDGMVDCADPDCAADPNCQVLPFELDCANGIDDDLDFAVDCADADCFSDPNCSTTPEICNNGQDDDGDFAVDCADADCAFFPSCDAGDGDCCSAHGNPGCSDEPGEDCVCALDPFCCNNLWDALCATAYQNQCGGTCTGQEVCGNGLDDDTDGAADCDDSDCWGDPGCVPPPPESACANNADDDGDGLVDCADPDCSASPSCQPLPFEVFCANLLDDDGDGFTDCADTDCFGQPSCILPPESDCDNTLDDDADGMVDCVDPNCATSPDCANGEICADGLDNDGDGLVDCDDDDCSADVSCVDPGDCTPIGNLSCGDVVSGSNFMSGSTNDDEVYCGYNPGGWFGPEVAWIFTPNADGFVEIGLSGLTDDLDIMALVQDNGCDPNDCEANGWNPPPQPESMDWFAFAGEPYYIVIDGWQGAESSFTMTVTCTPLHETDCGDGQDEDQDGDADCADNDCIGSAACPEVLCDNLIDDDGDGNADCGDPDCFLQPFCLPEMVCDNGIDDDQDGFVDCGDSDCAGVPSCASNDCCTASGTPGCADAQATACVCAIDPFCCGTAWDGICVSEYQSNCGGSCGTAELCGNGADDDGNGLVDCADPACAFDPGCLGAEVCGNGADDDGNGLVDCADPACAFDPGCGPGVEICGNGLDDDMDGDEDCFDSDCALDPSCLGETDCSNNFDDDADGQTDCDDSDCLGSPGCPVVLFSSVDDDPADFFWAPLGNHGSSTVWEQGVPNTTTQSGAGPTSAYNGTLAWCTGCSAPVTAGGRFNGYAVALPAPIDLSAFSSGTLTLSWWHWQVSPPLPWIDLSRVEVSTDGGQSSTEVWGPTAASTSSWQRVEVDLSPYLGTQLIVGFRYDSVTGFGGGSADGWYIDDVEIIWAP